MNTLAPATHLGAAAIDPADLSLPPTQPIDLSDIVTAQCASQGGEH